MRKRNLALPPPAWLAQNLLTFGVFSWLLNKAGKRFANWYFLFYFFFPKVSKLFLFLKCTAPCPNCRVPHKECIVCQAYLKVYGRDFLKHRFGRVPHRRTTSTPVYTSFASEPPRVRAPAFDDDPLNVSRAYSEPIPRSRRIFPREPNGYGSYLSSSSQEIHDRVEQSMRRRSPVPVSKHCSLITFNC